MSTVTPAALQQYQISERPEVESKSELGQDEFLKLMLTQLKHQDPMKPLENGEFIGQMAQFSTVSGIEQMQAALEDLSSAYGSSQTLQASQLVGQEVLIEGSTVNLQDEGDIGGRFELDAASGTVTMDVLDIAGGVVRHLDMGEHAAGRHDFVWDGLNDKGERMPAGTYTVSIAAASGDESIAASVMVSRLVESVEFGTGGTALLNTTAGESLALSDIRQIRKSQLAEQNK